MITTLGSSARRLIAASAIVALCSLASGCLTDRIPESFEPRAVLGKELLAKRKVFSSAALGGITDIVLRRPRADEPEAIIVAGTEGAAFLDPRGYGLQRSVQLTDGRPPHMPHVVFDADGDRKVEFFRGPHASSKAELHDDEGRLLWSAASPGGGFPHASFGDIDGDGKIEFLLWALQSEKVALRDHRGALVWGQRWERMGGDLQFLDTNGDGKDEIAYIDGEALRIRSGDGSLLSTLDLKDQGYVNALHATRYPLVEGPLRFVVGISLKQKERWDEQVYRVIELDGRTPVAEIAPEELWKYTLTRAARLEAPAPAYRVAVDLLKHQAPIAGFSATRLHLRVHDSTDGLVYEEVIASSEGEVAKGDGAFAVIPSDRVGEDVLLIGFGPDLWEYRVRRP